MFKGKLFLYVIIMLVVIGCASTTIPLRVAQPPNMNIAGITRVAVMDFRGSASNSQQIAAHITGIVRNQFSAMSHFTMVSPTEIERLQRTNQPLEHYVDALFEGEVSSVRIIPKEEKKKRKTRIEGNVEYTVYSIDIEVTFQYHFTRMRDRSIIGPITRIARINESGETRYDTNAINNLMQQAVNKQLDYLKGDVATQWMTVNRTIAKSKSSDKALQNRMKNAEAFVNQQNYRAALDLYIDIYNTTKDLAAAQNASTVYEAIDDKVAARDFAQRVFDETSSHTFRDIVANLNKTLQDHAIVQSSTGDNQNLRAKAVAHAINEVIQVLPPDARVWIYNRNQNDAIAQAIADDMTSDFIRRRISIADRQNRDLIAAEQRFQASGEVSDNDFVSIGNAMGVNTIVIVRISGTGYLRRLDIRVLNVERQETLMQSDSSEAWHI